MKTQILGTTLAILAVGSLGASAQEAGKRPGGDRSDRPVPPEILEKFDADGNGKLEGEERKKAAAARKGMMEKRRSAMIDKFDTDGDGQLSEDERKAAREAMAAKRAELLGKYDADGDGRLSPAERKAAIDAGEKIPPHPMKRGGLRGQFGGAGGNKGPSGTEGGDASDAL